MSVQRISLNSATNTFDLYGVEEHQQRVLNKTVRRDKLVESFAQ